VTKDCIVDFQGGNGSGVTVADQPTPAQNDVETAVDSTPEKAIVPWPEFLRTARNSDIKARFTAEVSEILVEHKLDQHCVLVLLEPIDSIDSTDLDQIFSALCALNPRHDKDVLLLLLSRGGSIEPAYQISKLCRAFARERFIAIVPRHAKSAATLIAIGADEIHMGPLGQLGPIDPQLGGLPALGVSQALKTIASVAERFPGSADMFARYLRMVLTVEQIGYCDRISESAVQYAVRLLSTKPQLPAKAEAIAKELVHEYKDHSFVIDVEEAKMHLGSDWVRTGTDELAAAEDIYRLFDTVNFLLGFVSSKRMLVTGGATLEESVMVLNKQQHS
jgi:hypothetical protein